MTATARQDLALWAGLLTGPVVWFISMEAKFALAPWVCAFGWKPAVYSVAEAGLAVTAWAGWLSWIQWRLLKGEPTSSRPRAMAAGGILLSAGFLIVLIAQSLPELILAGCE